TARARPSPPKNAIALRMRASCSHQPNSEEESTGESRKSECVEPEGHHAHADRERGADSMECQAAVTSNDPASRCEEDGYKGARAENAAFDQHLQVVVVDGRPTADTLERRRKLRRDDVPEAADADAHEPVLLKDVPRELV